MPEKLKDRFLTPSTVNDMAEAIRQCYPGFDKKGFKAAVLTDEFEAMELKTRMRYATERMYEFLPT